jgi:hypothetical protein
MTKFNRKQRRALKKQFVRDSKDWPNELKLVDSADLPEDQTAGLIELWRSSDFIVQVYEHNSAVLRMSVATVDSSRPPDKLPWPTLQRLKREIGRGSWEAVEIYPDDKDQVTADDMRHLWIFKNGTKLPFGFLRKVE